MHTIPEEEFYGTLNVGNRYGKIGVDGEAVHTGKDRHPERNRRSIPSRCEMAKRSAELFEQ